MLLKFFWLAVALGVGYLCMVKSREIVKIVGRSVWAEHKFGPGGSLTLWKIIGLIVAICGLLYFTGDYLGVATGLRSIFAPPR